LEKARQFNQDEGHFGRDITDYERILELSKQFAPFPLLWSACSSWKERSISWRTESFLKVKPNDVARELDQYQKDLAKAMKAPQIKNSAELSAMAGTSFTKIKEFEPHLPLIEALGPSDWFRGLFCGLTTTRRESRHASTPLGCIISGAWFRSASGCVIYSGFRHSRFASE
jgi:hypothetical protein